MSYRDEYIRYYDKPPYEEDEPRPKISRYESGNHNQHVENTHGSYHHLQGTYSSNLTNLSVETFDYSRQISEVNRRYEGTHILYNRDPSQLIADPPSNKGPEASRERSVLYHVDHQTNRNEIHYKRQQSPIRDYTTASQIAYNTIEQSPSYRDIPNQSVTRRTYYEEIQVDRQSDFVRGMEKLQSNGYEPKDLHDSVTNSYGESQLMPFVVQNRPNQPLTYPHSQSNSNQEDVTQHDLLRQLDLMSQDEKLKMMTLYKTLTTVQSANPHTKDDTICTAHTLPNRKEPYFKKIINEPPRYGNEMRLSEHYSQREMIVHEHGRGLEDQNTQRGFREHASQGRQRENEFGYDMKYPKTQERRRDHEVEKGMRECDTRRGEKSIQQLSMREEFICGNSRVDDLSNLNSAGAFTHTEIPGLCSDAAVLKAVKTEQEDSFIPGLDLGGTEQPSSSTLKTPGGTLFERLLNSLQRQSVRSHETTQALSSESHQQSSMLIKANIEGSLEKPFTISSNSSRSNSPDQRASTASNTAYQLSASSDSRPETKIDCQRPSSPDHLTTESIDFIARCQAKDTQSRIKVKTRENRMDSQLPVRLRKSSAMSGKYRLQDSYLHQKLGTSPQIDQHRDSRKRSRTPSSHRTSKDSYSSRSSRSISPSAGQRSSFRSDRRQSPGERRSRSPIPYKQKTSPLYGECDSGTLKRSRSRSTSASLRSFQRSDKNFERQTSNTSRRGRLFSSPPGQKSPLRSDKQHFFDDRPSNSLSHSSSKRRRYRSNSSSPRRKSIRRSRSSSSSASHSSSSRFNRHQSSEQRRSNSLNRVNDEPRRDRSNSSSSRCKSSLQSKNRRRSRRSRSRSSSAASNTSFGSDRHRLSDEKLERSTIHEKGRSRRGKSISSSRGRRSASRSKDKSRSRKSSSCTSSTKSERRQPSDLRRSNSPTWESKRVLKSREPKSKKLAKPSQPISLKPCQPISLVVNSTKDTDRAAGRKTKSGSSRSGRHHHSDKRQSFSPDNECLVDTQSKKYDRQDDKNSRRILSDAHSPKYMARSENRGSPSAKQRSSLKYDRRHHSDDRSRSPVGEDQNMRQSAALLSHTLNSPSSPVRSDFTFLKRRHRAKSRSISPKTRMIPVSDSYQLNTNQEQVKPHPVTFGVTSTLPDNTKKKHDLNIPVNPQLKQINKIIKQEVKREASSDAGQSASIIRFTQQVDIVTVKQSKSSVTFPAGMFAGRPEIPCYNEDKKTIKINKASHEDDSLPNLRVVSQSQRDGKDIKAKTMTTDFKSSNKKIQAGAKTAHQSASDVNVSKHKSKHNSKLANTIKESPDGTDYEPDRGSIIGRLTKQVISSSNTRWDSYFALYCDLCHIRLTELDARKHLAQSKHASSSLYFVPDTSAPDYDIHKKPCNAQLLTEGIGRCTIPLHVRDADMMVACLMCNLSVKVCLSPLLLAKHCATHKNERRVKGTHEYAYIKYVRDICRFTMSRAYLSSYFKRSLFPCLNCHMLFSSPKAVRQHVTKTGCYMEGTNIHQPDDHLQINSNPLRFGKNLAQLFCESCYVVLECNRVQDVVRHLVNDHGQRDKNVSEPVKLVWKLYELVKSEEKLLKTDLSDLIPQTRPCQKKTKNKKGKNANLEKIGGGGETHWPKFNMRKLTTQQQGSAGLGLRDVIKQPVQSAPKNKVHHMELDLGPGAVNQSTSVPFRAVQSEQPISSKHAVRPEARTGEIRKMNVGPPVLGPPGVITNPTLYTPSPTQAPAPALAPGVTHKPDPEALVISQVVSLASGGISQNISGFDGRLKIKSEQVTAVPQRQQVTEVPQTQQVTEVPQTQQVTAVPHTSTQQVKPYPFKVRRHVTDTLSLTGSRIKGLVRYLYCDQCHVKVSADMAEDHLLTTGHTSVSSYRVPLPHKRYGVCTSKMKSPHSDIWREHCWTLDKPLRDCHIVCVCLASTCTDELYISQSPIILSVHCSQHHQSADFQQPSSIRLNSVCNMAYFEYEGDVISVDISIDTLKQCVPDNLYPCLMCERKFGSAEEFIRHDHMGMSAGQFNKTNRELKNGEVLIVPYCMSCDIELQTHSEVKLIQHLVQYHGVKHEATKTKLSTVQVVYKRYVMREMAPAMIFAKRNRQARLSRKMREENNKGKKEVDSLSASAAVLTDEDNSSYESALYCDSCHQRVIHEEEALDHLITNKHTTVSRYRILHLILTTSPTGAAESTSTQPQLPQQRPDRARILEACSYTNPLHIRDCQYLIVCMMRFCSKEIRVFPSLLGMAAHYKLWHQDIKDDNHLAYYRLIRVMEERSYTVESLIKCYNSKSYRCVSPQCTETYTTIEEALRHMRVSSHSVIDNNDWSYKRRDKIPHSQTQPSVAMVFCMSCDVPFSPSEAGLLHHLVAEHGRREQGDQHDNSIVRVVFKLYELHKAELVPSFVDPVHESLVLDSINTAATDIP